MKVIKIVALVAVAVAIVVFAAPLARVIRSSANPAQLIQSAMATWESLGGIEPRDFRAMLLADAGVRARLDPAALDAALDPARDMRHVDTIFARVFAGA